MNTNNYIEKSGELGLYNNHQDRTLPEDSTYILCHPAISIPSILLTAGTAGHEISELLQKIDPLPDNGNTYKMLSTANALLILGLLYSAKEKKIAHNE